MITRTDIFPLCYLEDVIKHSRRAFVLYTKDYVTCVNKIELETWTLTIISTICVTDYPVRAHGINLSNLYHELELGSLRYKKISSKCIIMTKGCG